MIDTETTAVTHNVTADEFDYMPKTRSFQSVALTSPSVNSGDIEGGIQVNGASGAENQFTVDGIHFQLAGWMLPRMRHMSTSRKFR